MLVEPRSEGNVGSAARALRNLGFRRLVLVAPGCDPRGPESRRMAVDAFDVLEAAEVAPDLDAALAGTGAAVGTSRRTGRQRRPHWRLDELAPSFGPLVAAGELAFVFGREKHGLKDDELDRCTHLVHFPASDDYPSFNLAHSVLLAAYEMHLALVGPPAEPALEAPADHAERETMYAHLDAALHAIGYLKEDTDVGLMRRLRRILGRATLTPGDVKVVRGIARQILWVAGSRPEGPDA